MHIGMFETLAQAPCRLRRSGTDDGHYAPFAGEMMVRVGSEDHIARMDLEPPWHPRGGFHGLSGGRCDADLFGGRRIQPPIDRDLESCAFTATSFAVRCPCTSETDDHPVLIGEH